MKIVGLVDAIDEIIEKTEGNEIIRDLLLVHLYTNPSDDVNNDVRRLLNTLLKKNQKSLYKCGHDLCVKNSCYSHEISENVFLKHIADKNSKVLILKPDFKNNAFRYTFDTVHKRNASNFPGYCSQHDASLFFDIEAQFSGVNDLFINKHCLRVTRRELFKLEAKNNALQDLICKLSSINSEDAKELLKSFKNTLVVNEQSQERTLTLYKKINDGLITNNHVIKSKIFNVTKRGYCFSTMIDLTDCEDDELAVIFLIKLEYNNESKYIIGHFDNELSLKLSADLHPDNINGKMQLSEVMYVQKERFVFSINFSNNLCETTYKTLVGNPNFLNLDLFQKMDLADIFF